MAQNLCNSFPFVTTKIYQILVKTWKIGPKISNTKLIITEIAKYF